MMNNICVAEHVDYNYFYPVVIHLLLMFEIFRDFEGLSQKECV